MVFTFYLMAQKTQEFLSIKFLVFIIILILPPRTMMLTKTTCGIGYKQQWLLLHFMHVTKKLLLREGVVPAATKTTAQK
jgi:hypothetical protein